MTLPNEAKPKSLQRTQLIVEELGAELMIYNQKNNRAFCLNQKAAFVWQHCDGATSVAGIAAQLAEALGEPADETVVQFALKNLAHDGLLESSDLLPLLAPGMTRREMIQKLGVRAAASLPLVTALLVATPRAHASSGGKGKGKGKKNGD